MTTVTITCPNDCFEMELTGPSREHLETAALKDDPDPCPNCGEVTERKWNDD